MAVVAAAALALALALAWPRGLRAEATMGRHAGGAVSKAWSNAVARGGSSTANGYNATALFSSPEGAAPPTLWSRWLAGLSDRPDRPLAASLVADLAYCPPDHAMRRARSLVGDTQRLHAFMRKLRDGRCVRVLNIGGSVTHGRGIGGRQRAYGATFEALLNEAFPGCAPAEDAGLRRHEVVVRASGGTASRYALQQFEANMHGLEAQVDMVLVEFAPNDGFMTLSPNMKQENQMVAKRSGGAAAGSLSGERVIQWYTEALVRKVLGLRTANGTLAAAAVWLESSWMGEGLRDALLERNAPAATGTARAHVHAPMRANARMMDVTELMASLAHHAVLSWYGIPTVSLVDVMAPLTFNSFGVWNEGGYDASSAFAWSNIAADRCCHPNLAGHHVMALMLARELDREAQFYGVPRVKEEEDVSARPLSSSTTSAGASTLHVSRVKSVAPGSESDSKHAHLRPLLWLSPSDERKYLSPPYFNLDFMNPRLELGTVMAPGGLGWSFEEDVPGKQGLIAREAGSHAAIVLPMSDVQRAHPEVDRIVLVIGYLSSYKGFSSVSYWIDQTPSLAAERADALDPRRCRRDFNMSLERQVIDATRLSNRGNVSVFESAATKPIAVGDKPMYLHVCLHPDVARLTVDAARRRTKGKFKLLSVVAMHGGEGSE